MKKTLFVLLVSSFLLTGVHAVFAQTPPASTGTSFISLTNVPALGLSTTGSNVPSITAFLQDLYTVCIGIAVVLAVLQMIRGGITYMLGESMGTLEQAKHLILVSILGLILVLSPYIVFSIINPQILHLNIDTSGLQLSNTTVPNSTPAAGSSCTIAGGGTGVYEPGKGCISAGGDTGSTPAPECSQYQSSCPAGETSQSNGKGGCVCSS